MQVAQGAGRFAGHTNAGQKIVLEPPGDDEQRPVAW